MSRTVSQWLVLLVLAVGVAGCTLHHKPVTDDMGMDDGMSQDADGQVCGGIQGLPCPDGYFCDLPAGECRSADLQGQCVEQPEVCTQQYAPVCGCDGKTYGNDCERRAAGVQKDHDGECKM